jgi:hypothetical protein
VGKSDRRHNSPHGFKIPSLKTTNECQEPFTAAKFENHQRVSEAIHGRWTFVNSRLVGHTEVGFPRCGTG